MAVRCVLPVGVLLRYPVQLGVSNDLLLIVLCNGQQIFVFYILFHVGQVYFLWTIVSNITCTVWIIIVFNVNFWIFSLIIVRLFPFLHRSDGRRLIPFGTSLAGWDSTSNRVGTDLRRSQWVLSISSGVLIWVLILSWGLCYESLVGPRILMFLALVADVVIFYNLVLLFVVCLAEEIILLLHKRLLPGPFMWILLRFHQWSLVSTCWIDLGVQLSDVLRLSCRSFLQAAITNSQIAAADVSASPSRSWLEVHLGGPEYWGSFMVFLFGISSSHDLIILTLEFHLLYSLSLNAVKQGSFELLQFLHFVNIFHYISFLQFHFLLVICFLNHLFPHFLLPVLLHLLRDSAFKDWLWASRPRSWMGRPLVVASFDLW